jgi:hypothetical protein
MFTPSRPQSAVLVGTEESLATAVVPRAHKMLYDHTVSKTLIFCTSYIQKQPPNQTLNRWVKWRNYYKDRLSWFGADRLFIIDDGTPLALLEDTFNWFPAEVPFPVPLPDGVEMFRFPENLGRSTKKCFPGWWRSFTFSVKVARELGYTKIVHLESDAFVLTSRLAEKISSLSERWIALWCPSWEFAESAIQVICEDHFPELERLWENGLLTNWHVEGFAEKVLPFSDIVKNFTGDRYGGSKLNLKDYPKGADYVCQAMLDWHFSGLPPSTTVGF